MAAIIDTGHPGGRHGLSSLRMCLWLVALGGVRACSAPSPRSIFAAKAAIGFSAKLRHVLMAHIQTLSLHRAGYRRARSTLITRMNSDINQVQTGVNMTLRLLLRSPFVVFGAMVMAFTIDAQMRADLRGRDRRCCASSSFSASCCATIPLLSPRAGAAGQRDRARPAKTSTGVRVVRAFCKEDAESAKFERRRTAAAHPHAACRRAASAALMNPLTYVRHQRGGDRADLAAARCACRCGALTQGQVVALVQLHVADSRRADQAGEPDHHA